MNRRTFLSSAAVSTAALVLTPLEVLAEPKKFYSWQHAFFLPWLGEPAATEACLEATGAPIYTTDFSRSDTSQPKVIGKVLGFSLDEKNHLGVMCNELKVLIETDFEIEERTFLTGFICYGSSSWSFLNFFAFPKG